MQALPPQPDVSHLTADELEIIKNVLKKQELFENEIEKSLKYFAFLAFSTLTVYT
jgi:hypothetical protein